MGTKRCTGCGAELEIRPDRCPLCGTEPRSSPRSAVRVAAPGEPKEVDRYQEDLRDLREQLRQLREDAEAI